MPASRSPSGPSASTPGYLVLISARTTRSPPARQGVFLLAPGKVRQVVASGLEASAYVGDGTQCGWISKRRQKMPGSTSSEMSANSGSFSDW